MSLFLRKACQEQLDGVGLANYHIQVDESSKCLQVVGECGDVITSIAGIRLSRMAPVQSEIELAVSLFDDFLAKHTATFKGFIVAKARADKAYIPLKVDGLLNAEVEKQNYQNYWVLTFDMESRPETTINVKSNGSVSIPIMRLETILDNESIQHQISNRETTIVKNWIKACTEFHTATTEKIALLEKISTCEI